MKNLIFFLVFATFFNSINCLRAKRSPYDTSTSSGGGVSAWLLDSLIPKITTITTPTINTPTITTPTITYSGSPFSFSTNTAITTITPTVTGSPTSCTSAPALPTGLTINSTTGEISGTPIVPQGTTSYTITATNSAGNATATISILIRTLSSFIGRASSNDLNGWSSVTFGNGLFVAVAGAGTNRVITSPDGINWTGRASSNETNTWISVTYGNGLFVAVADFGTNRIMTSPDGITWTGRASSNEINAWRSVTYGNGLFVAVAGFGTNRVMTSPDRITWTGRASSNEINDWRSVTYGNGLFVAVAGSGASNGVMTATYQ